MILIFLTIIIRVVGGDNKLCSSEDLSPIKDILAKYENIIRLEVKGEIESIKKQISEI